MNNESGRRFMVLFVIILAISLFGYIILKPAPRGDYYQAPGSAEYFTDPDQKPEGNVEGFYSLLNTKQLGEKFDYTVIAAVRLKIESYLTSLPLSPRAVYFVDDSISGPDGAGFWQARFTTIDPYYSLHVLFTNSGGGTEVEIQ